MSELQNDSVESEVIKQAEIENQEIGADLATASESEHEEQPNVDEDAAKQEAIQKAINKKHFEAQQAKRELDAAKQRIAQFEAQQRDQMQTQVANIPPVPDAFDDDFDEKMRARDQALVAKANFDYQNQSFQQQQQYQQQQDMQAKQQAQAKLEQDFLANAKSSGAKDNEIVTVVNTLVQVGLNGDLGSAIMSDPEGYYIAKHLAANPMEAYELNQMNPILAGIKFIEIKAKAASLKPKKSNTPNPATHVNGSTVDPDAGKYKYIEGATFE